MKPVEDVAEARTFAQVVSALRDVSDAMAKLEDSAGLAAEKIELIGKMDAIKRTPILTGTEVTRDQILRAREHPRYRQMLEALCAEPDREWANERFNEFIMEVAPREGG